MRELSVVQAALVANPTVAISDPQIATGRHPNRLTNTLATGAALTTANNKNKLFYATNIAVNLHVSDQYRYKPTT